MTIEERPVEGEHLFGCKVCDEKQTWSNAQATMAAGVWHVYTAHPAAFAAVVGSDRGPRDPLPETLGTRLG